MDPAPTLAAELWRPPHQGGGGGGGRALEAASGVTEQSNGSRGAVAGRRRQREPPASEDDSSRIVSTSSGGGGHDLTDSEAKRFKGIKSSGDNGSLKTEAEIDSRNASKSVDRSPSPEAPKQDYIHVRARRGQATDSHSLAERARREKISERMKILQDLVPGCNKVIGKASVLDEIINYIQALQRQVEFLSMKLEAVNAHVNSGIEAFTSKDFGAQVYNTAPGLTFDPQTPREYAQGSTPSEWLHMQIGGTYERVT
ncbi:hypothetical protein ABZP36_019275 [Zizania latifolia]